MDAAILNSEGEREVIAMRKKNRITELKYDHTCAVVGDDPRGEFAKSVLLGMLKSSFASGIPFNGNQTITSNANANANANSDSNGSSHSSSQYSSSRGLLSITTNTSIGAQGTTPSNTLQAVGEFLDKWAEYYSMIKLSGQGQTMSNSSFSSSSINNNNNNSSSSSSSNNSSNGNNSNSGTTILLRPKPWLERPLSLLRERFVHLLLLEANAIKYHNEAAHGYLHALQHRITALSKEYGDKGITRKTQTSESRYAYHEDLNMGSVFVDVLSSTLEKEAEILEKGLYQIPPDGGQIPMIFRLADPNLAERLKGGMSVEKDGFEVLDGPVNANANAISSIANNVHNNSSSMNMNMNNNEEKEKEKEMGVGADSDEDFDSDEEDAFFAKMSGGGGGGGAKKGAKQVETGEGEVEDEFDSDEEDAFFAAMKNRG